MRTALVWFLQDLRIADNPALHDAVERYDVVIPVYFWTPDEHGDWAPGAAARWWLHHSLASLDADLRSMGSRLVLRHGPHALSLLRTLIEETGAEAVLWNARYEPALRARDRAVHGALRETGTKAHVHTGRILHDPRRLCTKSGGPYRVFTPFWRRFQDLVDVGQPLDRPRMGASSAPDAWPASVDLEDLRLLPVPYWAGGLEAAWSPGEDAAQRRLRTFVDDLLIDYGDGRDQPDRDGSSRLSSRLSHGELSARQVWNAVASWVQNGAMKRAADGYLREIAWREFAYHLLFHYPETATEPLREKFRAFPWRESEDGLRAWTTGRTGYPLVDAGMRQLWKTGWMHNRVRMIVASFLTKDLLVHWLEGARWFWDTLVDADLANNTLGWQWSAGSGADAQPFFRIFNPVSQGEKFDSAGAYVHEWVPELARLPAPWVHRPWDASPDVLEAAGVRLDTDYPHRLLDHAEARRRALEAWDTVRAAG